MIIRTSAVKGPGATYREERGPDGSRFQAWRDGLGARALARYGLDEDRNDPAFAGHRRRMRNARAFPGVTEVVACWGNPPDRCLNARLAATIDLLRAGPAPVTGWGRTNDGHPRHPLMLSYSTPRVPL